MHIYIYIYICHASVECVKLLGPTLRQEAGTWLAIKQQTNSNTLRFRPRLKVRVASCSLFLEGTCCEPRCARVYDTCCAVA